MGAQGSKAGGQMTAAAVQARRAAIAQAAQADARAAAAASQPAPAAAEAAAPEEAAAAAAEGAPRGEEGSPMHPVPVAQAQAAVVAPAQAPGGSALLETDAALIKAMNELGPAVKTIRLVGRPVIVGCGLIKSCVGRAR